MKFNQFEKYKEIGWQKILDLISPSDKKTFKEEMIKEMEKDQYLAKNK